MEQHLRAALAECEARLASLAAETQRTMDQRGYILRALRPLDVGRTAKASPVPAFSSRATRKNRKSAQVGPASATARPGAVGPIDLRVGDLPDDAESRILKVLEVAARAGTVLDVQRIARYAGLKLGTTKRQLQALVRAGRVLATGATVSRRYQLPIRRAAGAGQTVGAKEGD